MRCETPPEKISADAQHPRIKTAFLPRSGGVAFIDRGWLERPPGEDGDAVPSLLSADTIPAFAGLVKGFLREKA